MWLPPRGRRFLLITGMIKFTDQTGLNSALLPLKIHPSVKHIKKTIKVIYTLSMAINVFCFVYADGSAD